MKEAYAVRRTVPPSSEIQASIDKLLSRGMVDDPQSATRRSATLSAIAASAPDRGHNKLGKPLQLHVAAMPWRAIPAKPHDRLATDTITTTPGR